MRTDQAPVTMECRCCCPSSLCGEDLAAKGCVSVPRIAHPRRRAAAKMLPASAAVHCLAVDLLHPRGGALRIWILLS